MSYLRLVQAAQMTLPQTLARCNVLILHPQFRYHNPFIDVLLAGSQAKALHLTLSEPGTTALKLWGSLARELERVYGVALSPLTDVEMAARALGDAIRPLQRLLIILSAYDYAADDVHLLVARLASALPDEVVFVLDGRAWPNALIASLDSPQRAALVPVSPQDMLLDYLNRDPNRVLLEVHALGSGQVLVNGRHIAQWDGALPRALFFYFVDRGLATRDDIFSTFWPELSTREATNVFHVTKRKISEILQVDLTVYSSGFYRLAPNIDLHYDVVSFVEAVQESAIAEPDEAEELLRRAIRLHERDFLTDFVQPWAVRRREELRSTYVDALAGLARLLEDRGEIDEALGLYSRAFGVSPQREDLARQQMRLYGQAGQPDRALGVYHRLVTELKTSLGVTPSPETVALAEEVQRMAPAAC